MEYLIGILVYLIFNLLVLSTLFLGGKEEKELDKDLKREDNLRKYNFKK